MATDIQLEMTPNLSLTNSSVSSLATIQSHLSGESESRVSHEDLKHLHREEERSSNRAKLRALKDKTKKKTKKLLKLDHGNHVQEPMLHEGGIATQHITVDPAFNPSRISSRDDSPSSREPKGKAKPLRKVMKKVAHPVEAIKDTVMKRTAGKLSEVEHPAVSQQADIEFLDSHCNLPQELGTAAFPEVGTDEYFEMTAKLEANREKLRVAWITGGHVYRVRVVPKGFLNYPVSSSFKEFGEHGNVIEFHWVKWIGHVSRNSRDSIRYPGIYSSIKLILLGVQLLLYYTQDFAAQYVDEFDELPLDLRRLQSHVERLVMASAPWQSWLMHVRRVFRWEDPVETGRWLLLYLVLWYTQNLMSFVVRHLSQSVSLHRTT